jgi:hypothetical protein
MNFNRISVNIQQIYANKIIKPNKNKKDSKKSCLQRRLSHLEKPNTNKFGIRLGIQVIL